MEVSNYCYEDWAKISPKFLFKMNQEEILLLPSILELQTAHLGYSSSLFTVHEMIQGSILSPLGLKFDGWDKVLAITLSRSDNDEREFLVFFTLAFFLGLSFSLCRQNVFLGCCWRCCSLILSFALSFVLLLLLLLLAGIDMSCRNFPLDDWKDNILAPVLSCACCKTVSSDECLPMGTKYSSVSKEAIQRVHISTWIFCRVLRGSFSRGIGGGNIVVANLIRPINVTDQSLFYIGFQRGP